MATIRIIILAMSLSMLVLGQDKAKIRVFVDESDSWEMTGNTAGIDDVLGGEIRGGARPQTAEIVKTFHTRCPGLIITSKKERADYVVLLQHEGGKDLVRRDNKFVVYNREGDAIKSGSTRSLGNAVKDACQAIMADN